MDSFKILWVEDEQNHRNNLIQRVKDQFPTIDIEAPVSLQESFELLEKKDHTLLICDFQFGNWNDRKDSIDTKLFEKMIDKQKDLPFVSYSAGLNHTFKHPHIQITETEPTNDLIKFIQGQINLFESTNKFEENFDEIEGKNELIRSDSEKHIHRIGSDIKVVNAGLLELLSKKPELLMEIDWRQFEILIAELLESLDYDVTLGTGRNDGGKDIIAVKKDTLFHTVLAVECKHYFKQNVGRPDIQKLLGVVEGNRYNGGLLATSSFFTREATSFAEPMFPKILLRDINFIKKALVNYGEKTKNR